MALQPGTRIGPYQVTSLLGQGGMGEVYRARDTKLDSRRETPPSSVGGRANAEAGDEAAQTQRTERAPRLSPDGYWLAYVSNQPGQDQVVVQPFPFGGRVIQIPVGAGNPNYDVSLDGEQFLMVRSSGSQTAALIVVGNWFEELKRLAPTN